MSHVLAYPSAWDNSFSDYLTLDNHLVGHSNVLHSSRPCSSSSSSSHLLHDEQSRYEPAAQWVSNDLYHFDVEHSVESPLTSPEPEPESSPDTRVKQEDTQDDFIFEQPAANDADAPSFPAFSSMTEVPLRATQATKEMRVMMTVFRLDPFTMHNAVRDPTANVNWNGEPIGPLKESPILHEFQLDLPDRVKSEPPPVLHHVLLDEHQRSASRRHRPSPTPSPPLYASVDSPSLSPLDSQGPSWHHSSSDTASLGYSPDLVHSQPYDTVLTPAQGMEASMSMNFASRYSAPSLRMPSHSPSLTTSLSSITRQRSPMQHSSLSYGSSSSTSLSYPDASSSSSSSMPSYIHPSSTTSSSSSYSAPALGSSYLSHGSYGSSHHSGQARQGLSPYTIATPVRLPPLPPSRHYTSHEHANMLGSSADGSGAVHSSADADGIWLRNRISLAMFSTGKDASGATASSGGGGGMQLAPPHTVSSLAARRMTPSSLSGAVLGLPDLSRSARAAWS